MLSIAWVQVNEFFARCELSTSGANRTIQTDGIAEVGALYLTAQNSTGALSCCVICARCMTLLRVPAQMTGNDHVAYL